MAVFSAIAAAIGGVTAAIGAAGTALGALGATAIGGTGLTLGGVVGAAGLAASGYGAYAQYTAGKQQAAAQRRAEALRRKQTQLELNNSYLNSVRSAQAARAQNLVRGTSQLGSGAPFGSALANSSSAVESALGYQVDTTGQAGSIGFGIFDANAQYSAASTQKSIASGISNLGASVLGNLGGIERVGSYISGQYNLATGGGYNSWSSGTDVSYGDWTTTLK